uniref:hypothetical protein n=1 Tax=Acetivibrio cellulolyticus TaxID=35830 RepID=UPI0001E2F0FC|nr:hypothetical protein [Acetivibrio cellulolyticus]
MTRISDEEIFDYDILWFAVDSKGEIAQFDSGVYGLLPESVSKSEEQLENLAEYICERLEKSSETVISQDVFKRVILVNSKDETKLAYLERSLGFSKKGLYAYNSYDAEPNLYQYFKVSMPEKPLKLSDLPEEYRSILEQYKLENCVFREMDLITIK